MTQHYQTNTKQVMKWCNTCGRQTMHRVDHKRVGSCTEHSAEGLSKKQEADRKKREEEEQNPTLF